MDELSIWIKRTWDKADEAHTRGDDDECARYGRLWLIALAISDNDEHSEEQMVDALAMGFEDVRAAMYG